VPENLTNDTLVDWIIPSNAGADAHAPGAQAFGVVFKLLTPLLDELVDILLGSTRREATRMSDIHVKHAVKEFELGIQRQCQPDSLIHRHRINTAR
jgi:hypothetical protein